MAQELADELRVVHFPGLGDVFGAFTIVEMTQKDGQVLSLQDPEDPIFFNACEAGRVRRAPTRTGHRDARPCHRRR